MAVPFISGWDQAQGSQQQAWLDQQDREERAREINTQRQGARFRQDVAANLRPPSSPVAGLRTAGRMPPTQQAPLASPVSIPSGGTVTPAAPASPAAAAPATQAGLKTTRQSYAGPSRAENMPLPPAIPFDQMTPAQRDAYARYAQTALEQERVEYDPTGQVRPIERFLGHGRNNTGREVTYRAAERAGAVSSENTNISGSGYDLPGMSPDQMNPTQRAAYQNYVNLVARGANPQAVALARQDADRAGVFAAPQAGLPQTNASVSRALPATAQATPMPTGQPQAQAPTGTLDTRDPAALQRIAQAIGVQPGSGFRTPEENARVGGVENSFHTQGSAVDFPLSSFPAGTTLEQAGQHVTQRWQQAGFPPAEFNYTQHGTGPHVHVEWQNGGAPGQTYAMMPQTQSMIAPQVQQIFEAVASDAEGLPYLVTQADELYQQNLVVFQAAQAAGLPDEMLTAAAGMREANATALTAFGANAALIAQTTGDMEPFSRYFNLVTGGVDMTFQPLSDGTYQISVGGQLQGVGTRNEIASQIMELVNSEYAQARAEAASAAQEAALEQRNALDLETHQSNLRNRERIVTETAQGQREISVEAFQAEMERRNQRAEPVDLGNDRRGILYRNEQGQFVVREFRTVEQQSPSNGGQRTTQQVMVLGPEQVVPE